MLAIPDAYIHAEIIQLNAWSVALQVLDSRWSRECLDIMHHVGCLQ